MRGDGPHSPPGPSAERPDRARVVGPGGAKGISPPGAGSEGAGQPGPAGHPDKTFLRQKELATRWHMSPRTLEDWRHDHKGPPFIAFGRTVRYDLDEIERYEAESHGPPGGGGQPTEKKH